MGEWLLANSMRYTSFTVVENSMMHVIEFHRGYLGVSPPPFTWSRWMLKKLELCMAKENPEGRRRRPGLTSADVTLICDRVWDWVNNDLIPLGRRRFYVNCGAAIAATFTPALRTGETCPGANWNSRDYWSRQHIGRMLDASVLAQPGVESVLIKAMKRKTVYKNAAARQKSTQPIMYDAKASQSFSFALWGPKLQDLDPCKFGQELDTPAFRTGGPDSPALSVDILREFMRDIAEDVVEDWELHDYGCHSLRIGREAMLRETDARPETINDITAHTSTLGRAPSTERTRIRTVAGRILYRTGRLPWERELFSYAQSIRRLNKELESTRMQAAERWEVLAAKERFSQRLDKRLNKLYDTC
eukprot:COSAG01_NODE_442_length_17020_cov_26.699622_15_plen_360_part_00